LTGYLPLVSYLSWDLGLEISYSAGGVLQCTLRMENAQTEARWLYVIGALLDAETGQVIPGTGFGVLWDDGLGYAYNSAEYLSAFEVGAGSYITVPCVFTLPQSNACLSLVMCEMLGEEPAADDTIRGEVTTLLVQPAGFDLSAIMMPLIMVMMIGAMIPVISKQL
jgi:uncharacterized membrane protein YhdT